MLVFLIRSSSQDPINDSIISSAGETLNMMGPDVLKVKSFVKLNKLTSSVENLKL